MLRIKSLRSHLGKLFDNFLGIGRSELSLEGDSKLGYELFPGFIVLGRVVSRFSLLDGEVEFRSGDDVVVA